MLSVPLFDTYKVLPDYAREPRDKRNIIGLNLLKKRAQHELLWSAFSGTSPGMDYDTVVNLRVGALGGGKTSTRTDATAELFNPDTSLSQDERDSIYMKACAMAGVPVTADMLAHAREADKKAKETRKEEAPKASRRGGMRHTIDGRSDDTRNPSKGNTRRFFRLGDSR